MSGFSLPVACCCCFGHIQGGNVHTGKDLAISILVLLTVVGLYFLNLGLGICIRLDVYFSKSEKVAYAHAEAAALSGLLEYYKVRLL